jgi:8-oxo-dGTP pyrophosphatase MutT (NUDIX family)
MKPVTPKLSASLIIVDDADTEPRFLFGRRHARHVFMPNRYVFPGGRVDKFDAKVPVTLDMHPSDRLLVGSHLNGRHRNKGAEALALCAIREAWEESGQLFGKSGQFDMTHHDWRVFGENGFVPNLTALRLLARAVTPAALPRRYDTWFFMGFRSSIAFTANVCGPDSELDHQVWASEAESRAFDLPAITRMILREAVERLKSDADLSQSAAIPMFLTRGGVHMRKLLTA